MNNIQRIVAMLFLRNLPLLCLHQHWKKSLGMVDRGGTSLILFKPLGNLDPALAFYYSHWLVYCSNKSGISTN
ncbi:hypothetical protein PV328_007159 [Microctonus aethiopoides]|uniref:Uncharacterized protein n=1 Tax=Microctonus aethiopoides TaxID=144406 RepID=A0AA39KUF6_9HYME|nr:hypothetical protein PV328_007159 [Microctonus aethiopoides]